MQKLFATALFRSIVIHSIEYLKNICGRVFIQEKGISYHIQNKKCDMVSVSNTGTIGCQNALGVTRCGRIASVKSQIIGTIPSVRITRQ